ncbi:hypothetical protein CORC01_12955 [Colletotrichum orchidophilum]|uniref:Geranylgeranyl pyrophosphate synthetase n=1 Tax=Colletotrichum orchidophilum TaxID=1209926 RepID=A0A1G4ARD5_9PEZI|nr:uncharacterized protein CORC01_12955 [Colletotrichum orchidophilum]OHE91728.1 hypothetical protein CORC01_12955 [Colletotrichum orchidophilum]
MIPDFGIRYIDQNAARRPEYPLEPLFRAVCAQKPEFELSDVDIVTDRNNMRKLLRFVEAPASDSFEIKAEIAGKKTLLLTRVEENPTEIIKGFRGFGHNFEKTYTKGLIGSTGHHRIVSYHFGGMMFLLRHETDGYVANGVSSDIAGATSDLVDELSNRLGIMSVLQAPESIRDRMDIVSTKTRSVDVESTLEIKTRAASRTLAMEEVFPQLWLSQTPLLVVAYHQQNRFSDVKLHNVKQEVCDWESANRENLRKLAFLIKRIRQVVEERNGRRALVKYTGGSAVQITSGLQSRALADDLYSIWDELKQNECTAIPNRSEHPGIEPMMPYGSMSNARQCERDPDNKPAIRQPTGAIGTFTNTEGSASHSEIIERGLRYGFRRIIRSMPTRLSDYHSLCETLRFRQVDVLAGRSLRDIMRDMRQGKDDWDPDERHTIAGFKSLARDSAFRLLYAFVLDLPGVSDQNMAFNATMFVVSHRRIFKYKTRRMVREAFEERFLISRNQREGLDKWPIGDSPCADLREDAEETTSEEELYYFDSDSS